MGVLRGISNNGDLLFVEPSPLALASHRWCLLEAGSSSSIEPPFVMRGPAARLPASVGYRETWEFGPRHLALLDVRSFFFHQLTKTCAV